MRLLFVSAQLPGHLDWGGFLETACVLHKRGHEVLWASGEGVAQYLARADMPTHILSETGWRWPPPPPLAADEGSDPIARQRLRQIRSLDQWLDVGRVVTAVDELHSVVLNYRPHLIVGEMFMASAALVAEMTAIPFIVAGWPAPLDRPTTSSDPLLDTARARLNTLLRSCSIDGANWTAFAPPAVRSPLLHLTYWCPTWFDESPLGAQTKHVGAIRPSPQAPEPNANLPTDQDGPWVFITLGTTFNQDPNFFISAAHAAARLGAQPILALGTTPTSAMRDALAGRLPRNTQVSIRVDFTHVFPYVAAAIHHGGAGTTHALARYAIPQIIVPHAGDQARQARGIVRAGAGFHVPASQATLDLLENGLAELLSDLSPLRAGARALQHEMISLGGPPVAADLLLDVAEVHGTNASSV